MSNNNNDKQKDDNSSLFSNKPELPPLEKRTDEYSQIKIKEKKLIKFYDKFN